MYHLSRNIKQDPFCKTPGRQSECLPGALYLWLSRQNRACHAAGEGAVQNGRAASDEDSIHTGGELRRIGIGCAGMDGGKIKNIQVCIHAGRENALCFQAHDLCSTARAFMHGRFDGKRLLFADEVLQERCIRAVNARMEHPGDGIGAVGDHAAVCVAQDIADIVLGSNEIDHGHVAVRSLQQIKQCGKGVLPLLLRDGGDALPLIMPQILP